ncbi:MAG TPA: protease pro-enzyme activation domain-containing protein, partial [Terriglobia bacterium]|nr:protease pro-enzyme activation domain-containing protein [Terriglobia bacterium]
MNVSEKGYGVAVLRGLYVVLCSAMLLFVVESPAQGQSLLTSHVRQAVMSKEAKFLNRLPETQTLRIDIVLPLRDHAGLEKFLQEAYDPASPTYRHFLTVPEFAARFGPSQDDYDAVVRFAKQNGFTVVGGSRDAMDVQVEGSVTTIEAAFNVSMGVYQHPTENRTFFAPDREPTVTLPFPLWHISGLDNYSLPRPALVHGKPSENPNATTGSGPSASFLGSDMRAAYYGSGSLTGTGQSIGLLEFYGYDIADLNAYYTNVGQTRAAAVTGISTDGTSLTCIYPSCDDLEQTLDMTQALGMAPGITTLYVYVGSTDTAILGSMSSHSPLPSQLSSSWTWTPPDPSTDDPFFQKMAAQGQSYFQASGDSKAWSSSNDLYPSEDANVICVGGTDLQTSSAGGPWSSETAWVDSGGGISPSHLAIPSWQQLAGVINSSNKGSTTYRNGPDVSANADFTFYVCGDQTTCTANYYGGTSFAAPMWAGYIALANQQAKTNGDPVVGFINPAIYPIGVSSSYNTDFHDVTSGSNGFPAVIGYDLATGWGSPNGAALINALAASSSPNFTISASPSSQSVAPGGNTSYTVTIGALNGYTGTVNLSANGLPAGASASFAPASVTSSGTSTMSVTVGSATAPGSYSLTITGTDSVSSTLTHSTQVTLVVTGTPDFSISASGSLLRTRQKERDVVDFSLSCHETAVLPTWGTTELLQAQGFGQAFLDEALGGDHGGGSIRTRTLGGIQEYELLDLLQLFLQIF